MASERIRSRIAWRLQEEIAARRQWAVEHGLLPGHSNYVRFVVVSDIRSGSTMLTNMLSQHPNLRCFYELFHVDRSSIPFTVKGYRKRGHDFGVRELREKDPQAFLKAHVYTVMPPHIGAVGFKLLLTQARACPMWWDDPEFADWWADMDNAARNRWQDARSDLWATLAADSDLRIILLDRRNLLARAVSAAMAKTTGAWGDGATGGFGQIKDARVALPVRTLLRDFEASKRMFAETEALFSSHRLMRLSYEDLVDDQQGQGQRLQEFLGLPSQPIMATTRKQASGSYQDRVANWTEVEALLKGSSWSRLLSDQATEQP